LLQTFDAIVVGAGHNGLTAACCLARAGLKVCVVEKRRQVGGACVTEELWPGYKVSTTSYVSTLLHPRIVRDFGLERHGYRVYKQEPAFFQPFPDGRFLMLYGDEERDAREFAKFSARDAARLRAFHASLERLADLTCEVASLTPFHPPRIRPREIVPALRLLRSARRLSPADLARLAEVSTVGILDYVEGWFESEEIRAFYCSQGVIGAYGGPRTPGTAALLLHDFLGGVEGARGVWGVGRGGMGTITRALAAAAADLGVQIRAGCGVREIVVEPLSRARSSARSAAGAAAAAGDHEPGRAAGVVLESGETLRSRLVASAVDPKRTFLTLTPRRFLPAELVEAIERYRCLGASLKVHLALGELPDFSALPSPGGAAGPQHRGLIVFCPSVDYIERAWDEAKGGDLSSEPMVEACIHSVLDDSAAPAGKHVMSCFVQYGARHLRQGSWAALKPAVAERTIQVMSRYAPNLARAVERWHVYTPEDLEVEFGLTGGNIYHGAMTPSQLFSFRPAAGCADYRTPVDGLYLCASGAHPGGGVWGAVALNATRTILRDLR
jgi:phytoene dehydrogenase-like protein